MGDDDWANMCPLCVLPFTAHDLQFRPCACGYRMCVWCWHTIVTTDEFSASGRCPNCRADFDVAAIQRAKPHVVQRPPRKAIREREHLAELVIMDKRVVGVRGLPTAHIATVEDLCRFCYFGQYGRIVSAFVPRGHGTAVIRYATVDEAAACVAMVHGAVLHGQLLSAALIPVKYCGHFLKGIPCAKKFCVDLHTEVATRGVRVGESAASLPMMGVVPTATAPAPPPQHWIVTPKSASPKLASEEGDMGGGDFEALWSAWHGEECGARLGRQRLGIEFAHDFARQSGVTPARRGRGRGAAAAPPYTRPWEGACIVDEKVALPNAAALGSFSGARQ